MAQFVVYVKDLATILPLTGCTATIAGVSYTQSNLYGEGSYWWSSVSAGQRALHVEKAGYQTLDVSVTVYELPSSTTVYLVPVQVAPPPVEPPPVEPPVVPPVEPPAAPAGGLGISQDFLVMGGVVAVIFIAALELGHTHV